MNGTDVHVKRSGVHTDKHIVKRSLSKDREKIHIDSGSTTFPLYCKNIHPKL